MSIFLRSIGASLLLGLSLVSCSRDETQSNHDEQKDGPKERIKTESCKPFQKLEWRTSGSWIFEFEITAVGSEEFRFTNILTDWTRNTYLDFSLRKHENGLLFSQLRNLFSGNCTLSRTVRSERVETGLWDMVVVFDVDGNKMSLGDVGTSKVNAKFQDGSQFFLFSLRKFVMERIQYRSPDEP